MKRNKAYMMSKRGLTPLDQLTIKASAKKTEAEIQDIVMKAMLTLPIMVLKENYWKKSPKSKFVEFYKEMVNLYEAFGEDDFTLLDVKKYLKEELGIEVEEIG